MTRADDSTPRESQDREVSAFELLGLISSAPPSPADVGPAAPPSAPPQPSLLADLVPMAPVSDLPAPTPVAVAPSAETPPLTRREARAREAAAASSVPAPVAPAIPAPVAAPEPAPAFAAAPAPAPAAARPVALPDTFAEAPEAAPAPEARPRRAASRSASRPEPATAKLGRRRRAATAPPTRSRRPSAPARGRGHRKSWSARVLSSAALLLAGAFMVGLTLPANAVYNPDADAAAGAALSAEAVQTLSVDEAVSTDVAERSTFGVTSWAEILQQRYGQASYSYTVGTGDIQWPFPFPVPISDGFGDRVSPCRGCSSYHQGVDLIPGDGQPIYVIADGVVMAHDEANWSYGNTVEIEHEIDGQVITSKYAHMQYNSSPLQVGDVVSVGDFVGLVGNSGASTGPHLHLEIWIDGVKVNPFTWLQAKAAS